MFPITYNMTDGADCDWYAVDRDGNIAIFYLGDFSMGPCRMMPDCLTVNALARCSLFFLELNQYKVDKCLYYYDSGEKHYYSLLSKPSIPFQFSQLPDGLKKTLQGLILPISFDFEKTITSIPNSITFEHQCIQPVIAPTQDIIAENNRQWMELIDLYDLQMVYAERLGAYHLAKKTNKFDWLTPPLCPTCWEKSQSISVMSDEWAYGDKDSPWAMYRLHSCNLCQTSMDFNSRML